MTAQDIILSMISSAAVSGALAGVIVWLSREWISTRLKASIQHEYDQKLEAHKAQLKSENDIALLETKNRMEQQLTLFEATRTSFAEGQKAAIERRLDSTEKLWNEILRLKDECPPTLTFLNILSVEEYKDAPKLEHFSNAAEAWPIEKIIDYLVLSDSPVEKVRPYIGEYLWSMFFAYRQIMGRISCLLYESLEDSGKAEWHKDKGIRQILEAVLRENQLARFESTNLGKIAWLQEQLELKILTASQKVISGEEFGAESLKQAESIIQSVGNLDLTVRNP